MAMDATVHVKSDFSYRALIGYKAARPGEKKGTPNGAAFAAVFLVALGISKHQYRPLAILASAWMTCVAFRKGAGA